MEDEPTRTDSPRAPVVVLAAAFGFLALALVVIIVRPSTAPEPDPPAPTGRAAVTAEPDPDSGTSEQTMDLEDAEEIRSLMADGFEEDYAPHVNASEADCLAGAVLEVLGPDRLLRLTEAMVATATDDPDTPEDDPNLLTPDEERQLDLEMRPCVDEDTATRLDLG